ncbi:MAG: ATP-grasp domain-containing protein [Blastocatellia bacterium]|nr:ATP-grasp domain-containing protein [Blastocatellia bacterium]
MIVLSEATVHSPRTLSEQDNQQVTRAAALAGWRVYYIPNDFAVCEHADNALWHIPEQPQETLTVWVGFIPSFERYSELYAAAARKNLRLVNSPQEHIRAQEFDRFYPLLLGLTPESVTLTNPEDWPESVRSLPFPVFVRGAVRSRKADGWQACVASNSTELQAIVTSFFKSAYQSRGKVIVRQLVQLKHHRVTEQGFPLGREFRVIVFRGQVVGCGYYWEGHDPDMELSSAEAAEVHRLALLAAHRLEIPLLAVDVGQLTDGNWIVIEVNDAQFAGISQIPALGLWNALAEAVTNGTK